MAAVSDKKWCALVTRPREEAGAVVEALTARGVGPLLEIHFRETKPDLSGVAAVLCTSANGVQALARVSNERRLPLYAVGDATAARARALGFATVHSAGGNLADLVSLVAERLRPQGGLLLHAAGSEVAGDLVGELGRRGFAVRREVLYEARPAAGLSVVAKNALGTGAIDFALFYSPRTAAIFAQLAMAAGVAPACRTITALSISRAADAALGAFVWHRRLVAERPDQPALLAQLDRALAERRRG